MLPSHDFHLGRSDSAANMPSEFRATTDLSKIELVDIHAPQAHGHRILLVDDEILGTVTRAEILREHSYTVVVSHAPLEVLQRDLSVFDLAILDFQMPGLNGRELLLRMRALGAQFPTILLTGCLEAISFEDRKLFARCIDKGMPLCRLLEAIAEFLDQNHIPDLGS